MLFPFQARLEASSQVVWHDPLALRGLPHTFAIADAERRVYLVGRKDQPQPHLALLAQLDVDGDVARQLAQLPDGLIVPIERGGETELAAFALPDLTPGEKLKLAGGVAFGPETVGEAVFVVTDGDGLTCVENGLKTRWTLPLKGESLVAPPLAIDDDYLLVTTRGALVRVAGASGDVIKRIETQRPLAGSPVLLGSGWHCPGLDGAVYVVPASEVSP
jgi:hypothetical protein